MELRPLDASHDALLRSLQEQDDVWEFVGPLPDPEETQRLFAVVEGEVAVGIGGLGRSQALEGSDLQVVCARRSEAQRPGRAKGARQRIVARACRTATLARV